MPIGLNDIKEINSRMTSLSAIAFVGQNANGILAWWTQCIADRMARFGISVETIDLLQEGWPAKLDARLKQGRPDFCFSHQGIGMNLALESGNLWTSLKIPFIGIMGDAPYQAPNLHSASGPGKFFLYGVKEFADFYAHFMGGKNFATVLLPGYPSNPHASAIPWHKRDLELVFVKTGADPQAIRAGWANLPRLIRDVVEQASQTALAGQKDTIGQIVADAFAERQVHFGNRLALFMRSCWLVDSYVRAFRADRMARQVMRHGGHIFGKWPHLEQANSRAVFHGPIAAHELYKLYGRSRILANTAPCTLTGAHDRIVAAFLSKAFTLTDSSPARDESLGIYPSYKSAPIDDPAFPDAVDQRLSEIRQMAKDPNGTQMMLNDVFAKAEERFGLDQFIAKMLELLLLNNFEADSSFYEFNA
jgi:hypothetical protein